MRPRTIDSWLLILVCGVFVSSLASSKLAADEPATAPPAAVAPATVSQATKLLDLSTFSLIDGASEPTHRRLAALAYKAPGNVREVFALERQQLIDQKWQLSADAQISAQLASATFTRDGFSLVVTVFPAGKSGGVSIAITHLGNVDPEKLPVPGNATLVFPGAASAAFLTDMPLEQTVAACQKLLADRGWQPYGVTRDEMVLKQNAVRLTVRVLMAPGKADKTMVSYGCSLMSADLPAFPNATAVQYDDEQTELVFDSTATPTEISDFYRQTLGKTGWTATTDRPVVVDSRQTLVFDNPGHDRITLETHPADGKTRARVQQQTAAEMMRQSKAAPDAQPAG
jgi:hypothetical protein